MLLRQLSAAHKTLSNVKNSRIRYNMFNKAKNALLVDAIKRFRTINMSV